MSFWTASDFLITVRHGADPGLSAVRRRMEGPRWMQVELGGR